MKHTKGEWVGKVPSNQTTKERTEFFTSNDGSLIFEILHNEASRKEVEANAKLIAAAPEMFRLIILNYQGEVWIHEVIGKALGGEISYEEMIELKEEIKKATS